MPLKTICVIPARLESSRLPRKLLEPIEGKPLLYHTWKAAMGCEAFERVVIAVDHPELENVARAFGAKVMMTSQEHTCGTERVAEVARKVSCDLIVNLQADEPTMTREALKTLLAEMQASNGPYWTLANPISVEEALLPSVVKVVVKANGDALYFSRAPIPFPRSNRARYLKHLGVYGYTREGLDMWVSLPPSPLELAENLEQLRVLETGFPIRVIQVTGEFIAVDTVQDLWRVRTLFRLRPPDL